VTQDKMLRPESHMARRTVRLDEQGFAEMSKVVGQTVDKLVEIEKQSAQRLRKHESAEVPTVLVAMLFDAPDDDSADNDGRADGSAHRKSRRRTAVNIGK
jgi:hypothetical protein